MNKNDYQPLKLTEKDILFFTKRKYSALHFATYAVEYLRKHPHLFETPDYCRLYDELLDFLVEYAIENSGWDKTASSNRKQMEFVLDTISNNPPCERIQFEDDFMNRYLGYRRLIWAFAQTLN
jgi:hypothetical protein